MEHTLSSVIHDSELPRKMLDQLSELMRAKHESFDDGESLELMRGHLSRFNSSISEVHFDLENEITTMLVAFPILSLLTKVAKRLGLGKVDIET
jgi:hypothetical protein